MLNQIMQMNSSQKKGFAYRSTTRWSSANRTHFGQFRLCITIYDREKGKMLRAFNGCHSYRRSFFDLPPFSVKLAIVSGSMNDGTVSQQKDTIDLKVTSFVVCKCDQIPLYISKYQRQLKLTWQWRWLRWRRLFARTGKNRETPSTPRFAWNRDNLR